MEMSMSNTPEEDEIARLRTCIAGKRGHIDALVEQIWTLEGRLVTLDPDYKLGPSMVPKDICDLSIEGLNLPLRVSNILKGNKIEYIGDLIQCTEVNLACVPNLGRRSLDDVKEALAQRRLGLGTKLGGWVRSS